MFWEELGGCQIFQEAVEVDGSHPFISSLSFLACFLPFPAPVLGPVSPPHEQQPSPSHPMSLPSVRWAAAKWERNGTTFYQRETLNGAWMGSKKVAPWGKRSLVVFRRHVVRTFCFPNSNLFTYIQAGEKPLRLE